MPKTPIPSNKDPRMADIWLKSQLFKGIKCKCRQCGNLRWQALSVSMGWQVSSGLEFLMVEVTCEANLRANGACGYKAAIRDFIPRDISCPSQLAEKILRERVDEIIKDWRLMQVGPPPSPGTVVDQVDKALNDAVTRGGQKWRNAEAEALYKMGLDWGVHRKFTSKDAGAVDQEKDREPGTRDVDKFLDEQRDNMLGEMFG